MRLYTPTPFSVIGTNILILSLALCTPLLAQYDATAKEPIEKLKGTLILHGGGKFDERLRQAFLSPDPRRKNHLVIIPAAAESPPTNEELTQPWKALPFDSIEVLEITSRDDASKPEYVNLLRQATAVWMPGGDQERLAKLCVDTPIEKEIIEVIRRGGYVGGSSAGAAIATKVMLSRGEEHQGFDLLPGAVIDQHFTQRQRQPRLTKIIDNHPLLFGLGIDEDTAVIIDGRRVFVLGSGTATIYMAATPTAPSKSVVLQSGQRADLIALNRTVLARNAAKFPPSPAPTPHVPQGALVIVGGGGMPPGLMERFIELAGGAEAPIVYVPCLEEDDASGDRFAEVIRAAGAKKVTTLHTKNRQQANDDEQFLAPLREAKGIWFGGGRQWNLVDSYQNTTAHKLMLNVLERGGVIGGSSAGASIQGDYMPRGDPLGNLNIIAEGYEQGLGFLKGVAIDQHFAQRNRFRDMTQLIATYPQLLGIGIDEATAIIVEGSHAEVVGRGNVSFYDAALAVNPSPTQPEPTTEKTASSDDTTVGAPSSEGPGSPAQDYLSLPAGSRYDLAKREKLLSPSAQETP